MRRLAAIVLIAATLAPVPAAAERPAPQAPPVSVSFGTGAVGAVRLGPLSGPEWLASQYAAIAATGRVPRELADLLRTARAAAVTPTRYDLSGAFSVGDLDGDRLRDILFYRARFTATELGPRGRIDLAAYSGKSGALRWRRGFDDVGIPAVVDTPVGRKGRRGLLLLDVTRPTQDERSIRVTGLNGADGRTAYDVTVSTEDGDGGVAFGGLFDAYPGAGTDALISRVQEALTLPYGGLSLFVATPYVLDGADGTLREGHERSTVVASGLAYVASGDLDGDKRDDFLQLKNDALGAGVITAYSAVENRTLWERGELPPIHVTDVGSADITGGRQDDVLLSSWSPGSGLLKIPGVTDGLPLLDGPDDAIRGILLEGPTGSVVWNRLDGPYVGHYGTYADVNRDGKTDVLFLGLLFGERDGLRARVIDGKNRVLRKRDVTVEPPVGRNAIGVATAHGEGLDMDGDRIGDVRYAIESSSPLQKRQTRGFLLMKPNRVVTTNVEPLYGSLDGGSTERVSARFAHGRATWTIANGLRGSTYWTISGRADSTVFFEVGSFWKARGRCDDLLLGGRTKNALWVDVAHGGTGRIRWSRTMLGSRPAGTAPQLRRGAQVVCR